MSALLVTRVALLDLRSAPQAGRGAGAARAAFVLSQHDFAAVPSRGVFAFSTFLYA